MRSPELIVSDDYLVALLSDEVQVWLVCISVAAFALGIDLNEALVS